jgi:hypothetical protein
MHRKEYYFPVKLIQRRQDTIKILKENKDFKERKGILSTNTKGEIVFIPLTAIPEIDRPIEMSWPVKADAPDKRGVVTIYEEPPKDPDYLLYFAGVDPIEADITTTSNSLFSIDIIKRLVEVHYEEDGIKKVRYEGGNVVANYTGRYNTTEETNLQGELLLRLYNAKASKYLLKKREMPLFKDVDMTGDTNDEYGIYFGADEKAEQIMNGAIKEYLLQELGHIYKQGSYETKDIVKTIRGLDKIDNYWTLEELKLWKKGVNTDRRNSLGLAIIAAKSFETTYMKKVYEKQPLKRPQVKPAQSILPNMGRRNPKRPFSKSLLPK